MKGHIEEYFIKDEKGYKTNYYGNVLTGSGLRGGFSGKPWRGFDPSAKGRHWAIPKAVIDEIEEDLSDLNTQQKLDRLFELGYVKIYPDQAWPMYERYLNDTDGQPLSDIWTFQPYTKGTVFGTDDGIDEDVRWLSTKDKERTGYPTQKPIGLLERIISSCTSEGDVVLDPFCGCGTTVMAANNLKRKWVGIDLTHLAISLIRSRFREVNVAFGKDYTIVGEPADFESAIALSKADKFQFEWWALSLIEARPAKTPDKNKEWQGQKGADKGIDGWLTFKERDNENLKRIVVQVKGGEHIGAKDVRDLLGTVQNTKSAMGILITLHEPTQPMTEASLEAEYYKSPTWGHEYPKIQIITIPELLSGKKPNVPHTYSQRTMPNGLTKWVK
jgi:site-specific DNA-methyltransferase (adenine-specific)